ncbi:polysaccharide lyase family 8 super-sandwich domain-containing protein [Paenibacillus qinlingensis]|uniref:Fibronectin type 3 domain-containing protein n=1 Tax=Paenibacillus qinlingensis TaxID=1837343 RepID=A0ABU1P046_9BACL|nr:polysaccharide lyase family 8 super-sandwich domain-containing protein [Paenibacillus qinlingensis]MDR6553088.1 fibronectin type 3 domain-containing protein [Paenibacillus qinlingensis]
MTINLRNLKALLLVVAMLVNLAALPMTPAHAADASGDEYDLLRARMYDMLTGGPDYDPADAVIADKITNITSTAQNNWDTMNKSEGRAYLWSDMATTTESEHVSGSYQRLEAMTLAYATRGSALEHNAAMLADIISAMDWMYANRYNKNVVFRGYDNWFDWQISSPLSINNITTMIYSSLTPTQISNWHAVIDYQALTWGAGLTGANRVWACNIKISSGIIVKNNAKIIEGRDQLSSVFDYVTSGEGMYNDGSFLQHTALIAYNGGYGINLIDNLTKVMYIIAGSSWDITDPDVNNIYQWIYNAFEPLFYNNSMFDMVRGRNIARKASDDNGATSMGALGAAVVRMSYSAPSVEDRAAFKSMVKKWMLESTSPTKYADLSSIIIIIQTKQIVNDSSVIPRAAYIGNKQYPNMSKAVHHRPGYVFGISMSSDKVGNFEIVNEENLKGWHTGDGMTYLYNSDLEQYKDSFWPTINSYRLPGTTVNQNTTAAPNAKNPNNWVGGTEIDGLYGATGMQYTANGYNLKAKKSWFMFDDEIVSLGAGITSTDNKIVETIVENRKLNDGGNNALTVNGSTKPTELGWSETMDGVNSIHLAGNVPGSDIGYYFPTPSSIHGLRESRTDTWSSVNQYYQGSDYATEYTRNYMNLWFDHGTNPTNGTYDYVLLPGKSSEEVGQYANLPDIEVLANTPNVQAVKEKKLGITAINFWNDGLTTVDQITSNKKASVMIKKTEEDIEVSVSDPTKANTGTIDLVLDTDFGDIVYLDPGVSLNHVDGKAKLSVNVKNSLGKSFKVKFRLPGNNQALHTPTGLTAVVNSANSVKLTWNGVDRANTVPSAPTGLTVDGNTVSSLNVNWDAVPDSADYRLYRSTSEDGDYYSISDLSSGALSYTDTKLNSGSQYFYKVAAMNSKGMSAYSAVTSGWTVSAPPSGLKVVNVAGNSITLAWNEVPGATEYRLYRSATLTGEYESLTGPSVTAVTYTDSGIAEGTNYYYKVAALNPGGMSDVSAPIATLFNIPAYALNESFDDMTRGELNGQRGWNATVPAGTVGGEITVTEDSATSANVVMKKESTGDPVVSHTFSVPAGAYVTAEVTVSASNAEYKTVLDVRDSVAGKRAVNIIMQSGKIWGYSGSSKVDLVNPMEFNRAYRLKAVINTVTKKFDMYVDDQLLGSNWSYRESPVNNLDTVIFGLAGTTSAMTLDDIKISYVTAAPANLAVAERTGTGIKLTWNSVTGATGYRLYRSQNPTAGFTQVAEVASGTTFTDSGLTPKTNYFYKIVTLSNGAVSAESSVLTTATTNASGTDIPKAPVELYASDFTGSTIKLNWKAGKDAASYSIYRSTASSDLFELIGSTASLFYVDSGLNGTTSYNYKVISVNDEGVSPDSNIVSSTFGVVQTLVDDNFDNDALGADPAGWTIVEDTGRPVSVVEATYAAAPGHAVRVTGGNKLATSAERRFGDAQGYQGIVTVETSVLPKDTNWKNIPVVIDASNNATAHVYFSGGQIIAYNSSAKVTVSPVVSDGTWYKTKVVMNTNTKKYDLFLNDAATAAASQLAFRSTVTSTVYSVRMAVDNVSSFDFDNVKAYFKPFAPTALAASQNTNSSIKLTWGTSAGASSYKLYRSTSANEGYQMVYAGSALTYTDTGLQSGKTYYYKVAAVKGTAVSDASNMVTTATTGTPVATMAMPSLKREVSVLSAIVDTGQVGYIVYRDGVEVGRTFDTFIIDAPLEAGRTYQFTIAAYDNLGHTSHVSLPVAYTAPAITEENDSSDSDSTTPPPATGTPSTDATLKPQLDIQTGDAKVIVESKVIADGFGQLTADTAGTKVLPIEVPIVEGAISYTIVLPAQALTADTAAQHLALNTAIGNVVVSSNMLEQSDAVGAKEVGLTIAMVDPSKLSEALQAQNGNRPVIELHVTVDGKQVVYNNPDAPVKVSLPYKPTAEELKNPEHLVVWYIDGAGKAVSVPNGKYDPATGMVSFSTTHFSMYAIAYVFKTFDDILAYDWAKDAIEVMASKGIINGTSEVTFTPAANISRADFSLLLVKALSLSARGDSNFKLNFNDVSKDAYYYDAVATLKKLAIVQGSGENKFNPNETISRQDMMVIAARALRVVKKLSADAISADLNAFTDQSTVAAYAVSDLAAMVKEGLIQGSGGFLNPAGFATRAEAAVMMDRMYHK